MVIKSNPAVDLDIVSLPAHLVPLPVLVELVPDLLLCELLLRCQAWHSLAAGWPKGPNTDRAVLQVFLVRRVHMVGDDARVGRHREWALGAHSHLLKITGSVISIL